MFGFAGPIDHATHHSNFKLFDTWILVFPDRHAGTEIALNLFSHLLEESAGRASASGAGGDLRSEAANPKRLQNLLADKNFFSAVAVGGRCERYADGVPDAFLQKHCQPRCAAYNPFGAHASLCEPKMERVIAPGSEHAIDIDEVLNAAYLGAENDVVMRQAKLFGELR